MQNLNTIFYGPPGTGKTYTTARRAVEIIDGHAPVDRSELMQRFYALQEDGQIAFVTFHQSYSYEEFVEGIRPVLSGTRATESNGEQIAYECRSGAFREICSLATGAGTRSKSSIELDLDDTQVWKMSLGNTQNSDDAEVYEDAIEADLATLGYGLGLDFSGCSTKADVAAKLSDKNSNLAENDYNITAVHTFKNKMKIGDLIVVSDGNRKFRAIGRITGDYRFIPQMHFQQARPVEWLVSLKESLPRESILSRNFSQQTIYRLNRSALKSEALGELLSGDRQTSPRKHVLIIDEINRGNISKILGELITLLEPDKRIGAPNEVRVTLPYSRKPFGVPSNLYVIGTMNTADRSIALIDTALRRRFSFEEMMPDSDVLRRLLDNKGLLSGVDVPGLMDSINQRIEVLYDREHTIGHAYFLKASTLEELRDICVHQIIPLLQEYFFGDWARVAIVLGCSYNVESRPPSTKNRFPLLHAEGLELTDLVSDYDVEPSIRFSINPDFIGASEEQLPSFFDGALRSSGSPPTEG